MSVSHRHILVMIPIYFLNYIYFKHTNLNNLLPHLNPFFSKIQKLHHIRFLPYYYLYSFAPRLFLFPKLILPFLPSSASLTLSRVHLFWRWKYKLAKVFSQSKSITKRKLCWDENYELNYNYTTFYYSPTKLCISSWEWFKMWIV